MSFKLAASIAFKKGIKQAQPVHLEPIDSLDVPFRSQMGGSTITWQSFRYESLRSRGFIRYYSKFGVYDYRLEVRFLK